MAFSVLVKMGNREPPSTGLLVLRAFPESGKLTLRRAEVIVPKCPNPLLGRIFSTWVDSFLPRENIFFF